MNSALNKEKNYVKIGIVQFVIIGLLFMISYIHRSSTGAMASNLTLEFGLTNLDLASFAAVYQLAYTYTQLPAGYIIDKFGVKKVIIAGAALMTVGALMFSNADGFDLMRISRAIVGCGSGVCFGSMMKTNAIWFKREQFQTLAGLTSFMGNMGGMLAAAPLAYVIGLFGVKGTFNTLAILGAVILVAMVVVLKDKKDYPPAYIEQEKKDKENSGSKLGIFSGIFSLKYVLLVIFAGGITSCEIMFVAVWGIPFFENVYGYSTQAAANIITIATIGVVLSTLTVGFFDKLFKNKKIMMMVASGGYVICMILVLFVAGNAAIATALCFVIGYFGNLFFLLCLNLVRNILPSNNVGGGLTTYNFLFGNVNTLVSMASGYVLDLSGSDFTIVPKFYAAFGIVIMALILIIEFKSMSIIKESNATSEEVSA